MATKNEELKEKINRIYEYALSIESMTQENIPLTEEQRSKVHSFSEQIVQISSKILKTE